MVRATRLSVTLYVHCASCEADVVRSFQVRNTVVYTESYVVNVVSSLDGSVCVLKKT
jgi:hypothetical protein